uniref:Basal body-orientation factor 1 n=1 Tax=Trypanosoma congolense (strain IL3000) TaxID=1068625 RepID=G0V066_TRYCI|nr:conserved hypothetical protein [Trypanosoma congolense IL3000]
MQTRISPHSARRHRTTTPESGRRTSQNPSDVVVSTFANVDLRVTKAAMNDYARSCETMALENEKLRIELQRQEEESIKVVEHLKEQLEEAQSKVMKQQDEINRLQREINESTEEIRQQYTRMIEERDEQVSQYALLVHRLQNEMRAGAQSIHLRQEHLLEVQRLEDRIEEMKTEHECELSALRFQTVDRKMRLLALEETMRESFQAKVEQESSVMLEKKSHELLKNYRELQEERSRLVKDINELMQLATVKAAEFADERRKGNLRQHACEEALRRIAHSNKRSRDMQMKTQRLEQHVKDLLQEKKSVREELSRQYEGKISTLEKALAETQSSLRSHRAELQRMRYAASKVVEQRSDLEKFFYVALDDVRKMRTRLSKPKGSVAQSARVTSPSPSLYSSGALRQYNNCNTRLPHLPPSYKQQQMDGGGASVGNSAASPHSAGEAKTPALAPCAPEPQPHDQYPPVVPGAGKRTQQERSASQRRAPSGNVKSAVEGSVKGNLENKDNRLNIDLGEDGKGMYLNEMSWEDKEKIIKALLFFINQTCYQPVSKTGSDSQEELGKVVAS